MPKSKMYVLYKKYKKKVVHIYMLRASENSAN